MDKGNNPVYDVMKNLNVSVEKALELLNKSGGSVPDAIVLFYDPNFKKENIVQNDNKKNLKISELRNMLNNVYENKKNNINELNN